MLPRPPHPVLRELLLSGKRASNSDLERNSQVYGSVAVLDDVSLSLEAREFVAFLGP